MTDFTTTSKSLKALACSYYKRNSFDSEQHNKLVKKLMKEHNVAVQQRSHQDLTASDYPITVSKETFKVKYEGALLLREIVLFSSFIRIFKTTFIMFAL